MWPKLYKSLFLTGTLLFLGYPTNLYADECGVLRYLSNKSNGVTVTGNTCKMTDDISLGSEFNLSPGARLWFKSQLNAEASKTQGICQNRSSKSIQVRVDNGKQPWIKIKGLSQCGSWMDNKMNCGDDGDQKALSCVIATSSLAPHAKGLDERTTSVRMRSIPLIGGSESSPNGAESEKGQIISAMQPDISLCRAISFTDNTVNISWLVEANSKVASVILPAQPNDADKPFIDCLTAVIKDFPYPKLTQATWLSNQF
jgi:hypothetical protein